jgi:hypothetical protein
MAMNGLNAIVPEAQGSPDADPVATIAAVVGERRSAARFVVDLACTVFSGSLVREGTLRDVSEGGALLRGVVGLATDDIVHIRLPVNASRPFRVRVQGVSLLGAHLAIEGETEQALWQQAILDTAAWLAAVPTAPPVAAIEDAP